MDIRPGSEREGDVGFIPGSVWVDEEKLESEPDELLRLAGDRCVVLVCTTGKRAEARATWANESPELKDLSISYLEGGLLGWGAEGLPLVRPSAAPSGHEVCLQRLEDFPRAVVSCFVAESIETQLDAGDLHMENPAELVEKIFEEAENDAVDADHYRLLLDRLADQARRLGHSLEHIATNVETMRAALRPFDSSGG